MKRDVGLADAGVADEHGDGVVGEHGGPLRSGLLQDSLGDPGLRFADELITVSALLRHVRHFVVPVPRVV